MMIKRHWQAHTNTNLPVAGTSTSLKQLLLSPFCCFLLQTFHQLCISASFGAFWNCSFKPQIKKFLHAKSYSNSKSYIYLNYLHCLGDVPAKFVSKTL